MSDPADHPSAPSLVARAPLIEALRELVEARKAWLLACCEYHGDEDSDSLPVLVATSEYKAIKDRLDAAWEKARVLVGV